MVKLLDVVIPTRIRKETFKAFLMRRSEWMTSGSSSGEAVMIDGKRYPVNKRGWGETTKNGMLPSRNIIRTYLLKSR